MPITRPDWAHISAHGMTIGDKHTWRDFGLLPKEIPVFAPAIPKLSYEDIPLSDGSLDYTVSLMDKVAYADREGSFDFVCLHNGDWPAVYSEIAAYLGGRKYRCILDDDPNHYYEGRFWIDEWGSSGAYGELRIAYRVAPFKIAATGLIDWPWDALFDYVIYYGAINVSGTTTRTLIHPGMEAAPVAITVSAPMTMTAGGTTIQLAAGKNENVLTLSPGSETVVTFTGSGRVLIDYKIGEEL